MVPFHAHNLPASGLAYEAYGMQTGTLYFPTLTRHDVDGSIGSAIFVRISTVSQQCRTHERVRCSFGWYHVRTALGCASQAAFIWVQHKKKTCHRASSVRGTQRHAAIHARTSDRLPW